MTRVAKPPAVLAARAAETADALRVATEMLSPRLRYCPGYRIWSVLGDDGRWREEPDISAFVLLELATAVPALRSNKGSVRVSVLEGVVTGLKLSCAHWAEGAQ